MNINMPLRLPLVRRIKRVGLMKIRKNGEDYNNLLCYLVGWKVVERIDDNSLLNDYIIHLNFFE